MSGTLPEVSGWGRYPRIHGRIVPLPSEPDAAPAIIGVPGKVIPRGLGRSYGDASLSTSGASGAAESASSMLETSQLNSLISFDNNTGILQAGAGLSLAELLSIFVPQGWFVPVSPGTKWVSLGGAIASDIHGKNHHHAGSFGNHVLALDILLGSGELVHASSTEHPELFRATIGGMGLTGLIMSATVQLTRMRSSNIRQLTLKRPHLESVLDGFEEHAAADYSVAWLDTTAGGKNLGRSLLMLGEEANDEQLVAAGSARLQIPIEMPKLVMSPLSVRSFNWLYFHKELRESQSRLIPYDAYYYQLDAVRDWNLLYGKSGLVQYQCALPEQGGREALAELLGAMQAAALGSPITVLKKFGPGNDSPLSFPIAGYTLALDFVANAKSFALMDHFDQIVEAHGGRLYLSKDARMSELFFKRSYPKWEDFQRIREEYGALGKFASAQSERLGLEQ
ncbi:MAG: FAD-binding oxidoreductase [Microbacteriaceae bacterium]